MAVIVFGNEVVISLPENNEYYIGQVGLGGKIDTALLKKVDLAIANAKVTEFREKIKVGVLQREGRGKTRTGRDAVNLKKGEMNMVQAVYHLEEREVHMVGDHVGVVWNTKRQKKQSPKANGQPFVVIAPERDGEPYIDFVAIMDDSDEGIYEDDETVVTHGMSGEVALQVAQELTLAVEYLNSLPLP